MATQKKTKLAQNFARVLFPEVKLEKVSERSRQVQQDPFLCPNGKKHGEGIGDPIEVMGRRPGDLGDSSIGGARANNTLATVARQNQKWFELPNARSLTASTSRDKTLHQMR